MLQLRSLLLSLIQCSLIVGLFSKTESQELDEYFIDLAPELCELKIICFSKDIGSSISLLPSIMHRLENLLVAIELKRLLSASFPEAAAITANRVLEALTSEKCQERFSLERLETLGDSFLKFAVSRHLFLLYDTFDEGELTRKRSNAVNNSNLFKLACRRNLQVYIRDQAFDPTQFFALGRPCPRICTKESEGSIHGQYGGHAEGQANASEVRCSKGHHWLYKKTIADVVEALIGAFIVDSGFKAAMAFLRWIGIKVDFEASQVIKVCLASSRDIQLAASMDIDAPVKNLSKFQFHHKGLLLQAFVHPSYNKHGGGCYQRLEFLGDAVLDYLITSYLYSAYPKLKPGHLTDLRSALVNNRAFANIAIDQSFHKFLICDSSGLWKAIKEYVEFVKTPPVERDTLEEPKCPKVLGDLVESFFGAILLERGFDLNYTWKLMLSFLDPIMNLSNVQLNPVRELQELCQSRGWDLQFPTLKKGRMFLVEAKMNGKDIDVCASSSNLSRKEAVRIASEKIFEKLKDRGYTLKSGHLEEILRSSRKMEPKLIGYDECLIDVTVDVPQPDNLMVQGHSGRNLDPKTSSINQMNNMHRSCFESEQPSFPSELIQGQPSDTVADPRSDRDSQNTGQAVCVSARSRLYEICTANRWRAPFFECCHEEGESHLKFFTYKVVLEIEAVASFTLECWGAPHSRKKAAADHAAEGALKYLEQDGYLLESEITQKVSA
uniref:Dicer-like protein 4 isoform X1 n=1 Tax=Rhizophora mucronata TaxID=61149 RepID=A0A2P2K9Q1_RHIMU